MTAPSNTPLQKNMLPQRSELVQQQEAERLRALDPKRPVWVSASAGSGKTTLLTQRVLRLLLQNRIEKRKKLPNILCLTYTKAAAAEMQNRVHKQLALWATMPEAELQATLFDTFGINVVKDILKEARRLFAATLERPDAVRIMTMHSFCQLILNRFPHEAGLAPHFTLLEGEHKKLFEQSVLAEFYAEIKNNPELDDALNVLGHSQATSRTTGMFAEIFQNTAKWTQYFEDYPTRAAYAKALKTKLNLDFTGTVRELLEAQIVPEQELLQAASWLQSGTKTDKERGDTISLWVKDKENRAENFDEYVGAFLTNDETVLKTLATKDVKTKYPEAEPILRNEALRVQMLIQKCNALRYYHQNVAFYTLAQHLWELTHAAKRRHAQLTYDDLILTTRALFSRSELAPWILYKLDGGIDHILIDEAQDTGPEQWDIIFKLLEELLSGSGARVDAHRTLFVVGDEKQSIYSFQGANHRNYLNVKAKLIEMFRHLPEPMIEVDRIQSFRSTSAVLNVVDEVFASEETRKGVSKTEMRHYPSRKMRGYVELWEPIRGIEAEKTIPWAAPLSRDDTPQPSVLLAKKIARTISYWLLKGQHIKTHEGKSRAIHAGDIIILLQRRSLLLAPIIRALKEYNIPVAGIDRMVLHEQAVVQDILTLCRFLLLPQDDLTLAEVLRGPLVRISDAQLFTLAHKRTGTLWQAVQDAASRDAQLNSASDYLKALLNKADTISNFALLSHIYASPCPGNAQGGKAALVHRMGIDAIDPLEQLLSAARQHDALHARSLQLFVRAIANDDSELRREQSEAKGEVRIMTTHGAKGLEAPIVFIPDLMSDPHKLGKHPQVLWDEDGFAFPATPVANKIAVVDACKEFTKEARNEEHRRLLYVALTRAADVLILCSVLNKENGKLQPWQIHIQNAMQELGANAENIHGEPVWKLGDEQTLFLPSASDKNPVHVALEMPAWLNTPIAPITAKQSVYNPSALVQNNEKQLQPSVRPNASSFMRGRLLHRLLQLLPTIPDDQREAAAGRFLTHNGGEDADVVAQDVREVLAVLRNPVFAHVFSNEAKAEIPIIGTINGKQFSGQIDRLLVTDTEVLIVDFKTNRPPPKNIADVDDAYVAQMACYKILLEQIYPNRTIRAGLLWTHTLTLMELDNAALQRGQNLLNKLDS